MPSAIDSGGDNYYTYLSYETMFNPVILMNGVLYYNIANPPEYGFKAVDLRTGDQLWYQNTTQDPLAVRQPYGGFAKQNYPQLSFGQELNYISQTKKVHYPTSGAFIQFPMAQMFGQCMTPSAATG